MIFLDTNYLIGVATLRSPIGGKVKIWIESGELIGASAVAWSEFLSGPLTAEQRYLAEAIVEDRIAPFGAVEAERAAFLFNEIGRQRSLRIDTFIAATAIESGARLATKNARDFRVFVPLGLRLV